jgi:hypothetical protein
LLAAAGPAGAGQVYYVSALAGNVVHRLEDLNGDGDALDAGETTVWVNGLDQPRGLATDGPALLVVDSGNGRVLRCEDLNGDGDALDAGETTIWAAGISLPYVPARAPGGVVYVSVSSEDTVLRTVDLNGDGDALDADEVTPYAAGINAAHGILVMADVLLVAAEIDDRIYRLEDLNGDGDALDAGENVLHATPPGDPTGLLDAGGGCYFASAEVGDAVYTVCDLNGDGDALDVGELLPFAGGVLAGLDAPMGLAASCNGAFVLVERVDGEVARVRDLNGDGDAYDIGEVLPFATGLAQPFDIVGADIDGDDVIDCADNCPGDFNPDQADTNGNGMGDVCDTCVWDLDNSGDVGITDFLLLLALWGTDPGGPPDFDGDGDVGITDFLVLLGNWGPCP